MTIQKIVRMYKRGSVSCSGMRGSGKDILTANVIARRGGYYVSNVDYKSRVRFKKSRYIRFNPALLRVGNSYKEFIENKVKSYIYPYPDGTDIYISDAGVYFPAQHCSELNRDYKDIPTFMALSRQLGDCNVHVNSQALNRVWDKIREQSDQYIVCQWCKVIGRVVVQCIRIYERYQTAVDNIPPCRVKMPLLSPERRQRAMLERERYLLQYGRIQSRLLIYFNKSDYDTRIFKSILEGGQNEEVQRLKNT